MSTPKLSLEEALQEWAKAPHDYESVVNTQRSAAVDRFPLSGWPTMAVEDYALGIPGKAGFCYWMEFRATDLGGIGGGSARKHLIFRRASGEWWYQPRYSSLEEAWEAIRAGFVRAFELAAAGSFAEISEVAALDQGPALSAKALSIYFPDDFIPIFSHAHQGHFWDLLGGTGELEWGPLGSRRLLELAWSRPEFAGWKPIDIEQFLYFWAHPRETRRVVKIAPGADAKYWPECKAGGYICVGWDAVGSLLDFETKDEFRARFHDAYGAEYSTESKLSAKANEVWTLRELEPGDIVVANHGTSQVLAIGTVVDPGYEWRDDRPEFKHCVRVSWDEKFAGQIEPIKSLATVTVATVPNSTYQRIVKGTGGTPASPQIVEPIFEDIEEALTRKGQVILYGPPGTGKTYQGSRFAVWWLRKCARAADADVLLASTEAFDKAERELATVKLPQRVWWVVANEKEWSWDQLPAGETITYRYGRFRKNYAQLQVGDLVLGYQSAPDKRIVALAQIAEGLHDVNGELKITIKSIVKIGNGITYDELIKDPILADSEPIRTRNQGTLFALSEAEAAHALAILADRNPGLPIPQPDEAEVGHLTRVTFHPSYTYEDFVEGYRPIDDGSSQLVLRLKDGVFKRICRAAIERPSETYLLFIDEINRGNIPKIFGELITLLERDKRKTAVLLPQSQEQLPVPENVYIIGTMNTADRSIRLLDAALRRRFAFVEFLPDLAPLAGASVDGLALDVLLRELNRRITDNVGREKQIGHSFLLRSDGLPVTDADELARRFRQDILPLLQEYAYDDYTALAQYVGPGIVDAKEQRIRADVLKDSAALVAALRTFFDPKADQTPPPAV